ncbi:MAG TPA: hypothetical protein VFH88_06395 [Candidatus Krumholzibacteria bacterium]|nr:hypothetical protein [Candidatus Krumholzibacteria bacterium]
MAVHDNYAHGERRRPFAAFLIAALLAIPSASWAVDIPFTQLFFGRQFRSLLEDAAHYPASFVSAEGSYWDIYHERRNLRLQDYEQKMGAITAITHRGHLLLGVSAWTDRLSLEQENLYTDADRLTGQRENNGAKGIAGYSLARDLPLGVSRMDALAAAGGNGAFLGELELQLFWNDAASFLVVGETMSNALEVDEEINGSRFPFRFPFDTDRWFARFQLNTQPACIRAWGLYEGNSGSGDAVKEFENRVWWQRYGVGASLDYHLEPAYRLQLTPHLSPGVTRGPGARLRVDYTDATLDLAMYFQDVRYMHLDDLSITNPIVRLDVVPLPWLSFFGGWERLHAEHHGDSFFDVWPFTIWDVFTARRYRVGDFDTHLDTWFAGAAGRLEKKRFLGELSTRFEWWSSDTDLEWLERIDVLFPFFFRYESHQRSWSLGSDYAVQTDVAVWWRFTAAMWLRVSGRATVPIAAGGSAGGGAGDGSGGGGSAGGTPATPGTNSTHGGLIGTAEIVIGR